MITARDGAKHLEYAENYIKKGIPVWIDKPITRSVQEVLKLVSMAREYGAVLSGGSSLEFVETILKYAKKVKENPENIAGAHITAPVMMDNPNGGFWFYSQHLVAMVTTIFGCDIKSVRAVRNKNGVHAIYSYENFDVTVYFGTGYSVTLYTSNFSVESETFDLPDDFYLPELRTFYNVIKTGKPDKTVRDYIAPVCILEATVKAYETNEKIIIEIPKV